MVRSLTTGMLVVLLLLAGGVGYAAGFISGVWRALPEATVTVQEDTHTAESTVRLDRIRNGMLQGEVRGNVRLFLGEHQILAESGAVFQFPAGPLLRPEVVIHIPEGMQFVASKRGSKYYGVYSAGAQHIVPENRVYFPTKEAAERAGFHP